MLSDTPLWIGDNNVEIKENTVRLMENQGLQIVEWNAGIFNKPIFSATNNRNKKRLKSLHVIYYDV